MTSPMSGIEDLLGCGISDVDDISFEVLSLHLSPYLLLFWVDDDDDDAVKSINKLRNRLCTLSYNGLNGFVFHLAF